MKARLLFFGYLRGIGFRATLKQVAESFALKGLVRNLASGGVEAYCEGRKRDITAFVRELKALCTSSGYSVPRITRVNCRFQGQKGYSGPWKPYSGFEIDYGIGFLTQTESVLLNDNEYAKFFFSEFNRELKRLTREMESRMALILKTCEELSGNRHRWREPSKNLRQYGHGMPKRGRKNTSRRTRGL